MEISTIKQIRLTNYYSGDAIDVTISLTDIDLTGKSLVAQVRASASGVLIAEFKESDGSLVKTVTSTELATIRLYRSSNAPLIPALPITIPVSTYIFTIVAFSSIDDVQTIAAGTMQCLTQPTQIVSHDDSIIESSYLSVASTITVDLTANADYILELGINEPKIIQIFGADGYTFGFQKVFEGNIWKVIIPSTLINQTVSINILY